MWALQPEMGQMLIISAKQFQLMEDMTWPTWVKGHAKAMADLLPDVAAAYSELEWRQRIEALLRRADLHGMVRETETTAYCYGSLTLGAGFESRPEMPWFAEAMAQSGDARAELLWDGFEAATGAA